MDNNSKYLERGPGEIALFAITFLAIVLIAAGVVTGVLGVTITGFGLAFIAVSCFLIGSYLSED